MDKVETEKLEHVCEKLIASERLLHRDWAGMRGGRTEPISGAQHRLVSTITWLRQSEEAKQILDEGGLEVQMRRAL